VKTADPLPVRMGYTTERRPSLPASILAALDEEVRKRGGVVDAERGVYFIPRDPSAVSGAAWKGR